MDLNLLLITSTGVIGGGGARKGKCSHPSIFLPKDIFWLLSWRGALKYINIFKTIFWVVERQKNKEIKFAFYGMQNSFIWVPNTHGRFPPPHPTRRHRPPNDISQVTPMSTADCDSGQLKRLDNGVASPRALYGHLESSSGNTDPFIQEGPTGFSPGWNRLQREADNLSFIQFFSQFIPRRFPHCRPYISKLWNTGWMEPIYIFTTFVKRDWGNPWQSIGDLRAEKLKQIHSKTKIMFTT